MNTTDYTSLSPAEKTALVRQFMATGTTEAAAPMAHTGVVVNAAVMPEGKEADDRDYGSWADDEYVQRVFRFVSVGTMRPQVGFFPMTVEMTEKALKGAVKLYKAKKDKNGKCNYRKVFTDHNKSIQAWVGHVAAAWWDEGDDDTPAGINGTIRADRQADPRVARGLETEVLNATSVGLDMEWRKSHPKMDDEAFFWACVEGGNGDDGEPVRLIATKVKDIFEQSIVWDGADANAKLLASRMDAFLPPAPEQDSSITNDAGTAPANPEETTMDLSNVFAALGLPDSADPEAALSAVQAMSEDRKAFQARAEEAEAKLATIEAERKEAAIASTIDAALSDGKITPAAKDHYVALAHHDLSAVQALFASMAKGAAVPVQPLVEEPAVEVEASKGDGECLTEAQKQHAEKLGVSEEAYLASYKETRK